MIFAIALVVLSVLLGAVFLLGLVRPRRFIARAGRFMAGPGPGGAAAVRLLLAALLWFSAPVSATPATFRSMAVVVLAAALIRLMLGRAAMSRTLDSNGELAADRHPASVRGRVGALRVHAMVGVVGFRWVLIRFVPAGPRSRGAHSIRRASRSW